MFSVLYYQSSWSFNSKVTSVIFQAPKTKSRCTLTNWPRTRSSVCLSGTSPTLTCTDTRQSRSSKWFPGKLWPRDSENKILFQTSDVLSDGVESRFLKWLEGLVVGTSMKVPYSSIYQLYYITSNYCKLQKLQKCASSHLWNYSMPFPLDNLLYIGNLSTVNQQVNEWCYFTRPSPYLIPQG